MGRGSNEGGAHLATLVIKSAIVKTFLEAASVPRRKCSLVHRCSHWHWQDNRVPHVCCCGWQSPSNNTTGHNTKASLFVRLFVDSEVCGVVARKRLIIGSIWPRETHADQSLK